MRKVKLINIPFPVPEQEVVNLLFELHCLYREGKTAAKAYDDMVATFKSHEYPTLSTAQRILDGAHEAREAEIAHIRDRIFTKLRDFFEPLKHDPSV
mgnify:CR=1 FL=1